MQHNLTTEGNPNSAVKTLVAKNCALCAKERNAILKQSRSNPQLLVNSNNKICGVCRHTRWFHRCAKQTIPAMMSQSMTKESVQHTKFQQRTQQKKDNPLLHWAFQHLVQTSPLNHQIHQRQIQSSMVESVYVLPQIHQPQRNLSRRFVQETHCWTNIPRL